MDIRWPLPDRPTFDQILAALPDGDTKTRLATSTHDVHHSGQADVLVTPDLTLKIARNANQVKSLAEETAVLELLTQHDVAATADIALPKVISTLKNDAGVAVATLRETVPGENPMKLAGEGQFGPAEKTAVGHAIADLQAKMGIIGRAETRAHHALCKLPSMRPRQDIDKLNAGGDLLVAEKPDVAQQVTWAREVLAARRDKINGDTVHLVEADTHINNTVLDPTTGKVGFFDFGVCGWTSTPEIIFKRFAEHPEVCLAAIERYQQLTGYVVDRELVIALAIGDQMGYNAPRQGDKPNPLQAVQVEQKTSTRITGFLECYERTRKLLMGEEPHPAPPARAQPTNTAAAPDDKPAGP